MDLLKKLQTTKERKRFKLMRESAKTELAMYVAEHFTDILQIQHYINTYYDCVDFDPNFIYPTFKKGKVIFHDKKNISPFLREVIKQNYDLAKVLKIEHKNVRQLTELNSDDERSEEAELEQ